MKLQLIKSDLLSEFLEKVGDLETVINASKFLKNLIPRLKPWAIS